MYQFETYRVQAAYAQAQRHLAPTEFSAAHIALSLYQRARAGAIWARIWASLRRKPHGLLPLSRVERSGMVTARRYLGLRCVSIDRVHGSSGRSGDFDAGFRPLQANSRGRWVSLAAAVLAGVVFPPVTLVQVQDTYFVMDGHHRISVAKALGQKEVDAEVTAWDLLSPSPSLSLANAPRTLYQTA